ncbi:hypothetical protein Tco_0073870 [Tanacetum coccineum]
MRESSSKQVMDEPNPSGSGTQEQMDEFDAWMDNFRTNDDEVPSEEVSPELLKEISKEVDEAQLQKDVHEMLRARCNSGEEHQYHLDQMKNYLKSDIVWERRNEDLSLQIPQKPARVYQSFERYLKAPPMTMLNQDLFYMKTLYDLGHEHKYITEIVVRRADGKFGAISKSDYKYLHKNDIEDLYLLYINEVASYGKEFMITSWAWKVIGLIYKNNKKEKRVMEIKEIPKFCDATLKRVLKIVEKKNKDVKHIYANPKLSDNDAEYLRFY